MAEKKNTSKKSNTSAKTKTANTNKKAKEVKEVKEIKEEVILEVDTSKTKKEKKKKDKKVKNSKIKTWFNNLTLEQIAIYGVLIIVILLIVLIAVSTKNTTTSKGNDIVVKLKGKTFTADDLYKKLKEKYGKNVAIDLVDEYILDKEYKTDEDMIDSAEATINNYKSNYGDNYKSFLEYNGIKDDKELKTLLIKNEKQSKAIEDYIKENLSEKEMKDYYETSIKGDVKASHILISTDAGEDATDEEKENKKNEAKAKAEEIIEKIKNGEDFATLAKEYSDDTGTKENGGDLGYFNTGEMVQEFEDAAYNLDVDKYTTEPVETTYGYHIILKTGQKDKPSYKKSKSKIIEKLIEEKKENDENIATKAIINLRKKYKMNIKDKTVKSDYDDYLKTATTTTKTSE